MGTTMLMWRGQTEARTALAICVAALSASSIYGQAGVLTWHNDNARTGQNLQETILTPANVSAPTFGKLFLIGVDGKVDAQPLYMPSVTISGKGAHNVLYVMTEHDSAYAFDADTGTLLWHVSLLGPKETTSDDRGCFQVTPEIGVTTTPAIDPQTGPHGTIYVIAMSKDGLGNYHHRLHALDLTTGAEQFAGPVEIQATYPGSGVEGAGGMLTFDPGQHKHRAALVILNGVVYTSWSSHCDYFPYTSWVIGYNKSTLAQVSVLNLTPNGREGGIWSSGSGPATDAAGNLYLLMGNGTFETTLNAGGFPVNGDFGNAFMKLSTGGGTLAVADYFNMSTTISESSGDVDLGSGGVLLLPPLNDAQGQPRALAVGAGKDQHIYVVDRGNLGKFNPSTNAIYQELPSSLSGQVFSSPAWFDGKLYYGAAGDNLRAFSFANGAFGANPVSQSPNSFGYPGTTPSISANGTSNGIVWAAENGSTAVLHAYDASDLSKELYNSNQAANGRDNFGAGNKFIVPTIVNGKVYVGTTNGVGVFALLLPTDFTLSASPSSQTVTQGGSTSYSVTINPTGGFTGQVTLSVSGLPSGAGGSFTPNPATGSSTLSVTTKASTSTGTYTLTITGVSGTLSHTTTVALVVSATGDFTLNALPSSRTVTQGGSTSYGVTINPTGAFTGQITLSLSGLPSGAGGSFTPNPATASSTLSVTTGTSTPAGTYTLTITGVSGTLTHTTTVSLKTR